MKFRYDTSTVSGKSMIHDFKENNKMNHVLKEKNKMNHVLWRITK